MEPQNHLNSYINAEKNKKEYIDLTRFNYITKLYRSKRNDVRIKYTDLWNRIESQDINPQIYKKLTYIKKWGSWNVKRKNTLSNGEGRTLETHTK